ncbi:MAG: PilZ domain-containing protein [Bdellovibrionales bacterium]|nr:PilZ domain-containing protein [Bdellovibrionales bacterium]
MREKPMSLYFLVFLAWGIGVGLPIQVAAMYQYDATDLDLLWMNLSIPNRTVMLSAAITGFLVLVASRWALGALLLFCIAVIWNNIYVGSFALDFSMIETTIASTALVASTAIGLLTGAFSALSDRKNQWWKTAPRKKTGIPVTVFPFNGEEIRVNAFDISRSGVFITTSRSELKEGDRVNLQLDFDNHKRVRCEGEIVRRSDGNGRYPIGLGLRFVEVDEHNQELLQESLNAPELTL